LAGRRAVFFWPNVYRLSSPGSRHAKRSLPFSAEQPSVSKATAREKLHAMSKRREAAGGVVIYRIVLRETLIDLQRLQNDGGS